MTNTNWFFEEWHQEDMDEIRLRLATQEADRRLRAQVWRQERQRQQRRERLTECLTWLLFTLVFALILLLMIHA